MSDSETDFETGAEFHAVVDSGSLRDARQEVEDEFGDIEVTVDAVAQHGGGGSSRGRGGGGRGSLTETNAVLSDLDDLAMERNDILRELLDETEQGNRMRGRARLGGGGALGLILAGAAGATGLGLAGLKEALENFDVDIPDGIPLIDAPDGIPLTNIPDEIPVDAPDIIPVDAPSSIPLRLPGSEPMPTDPTPRPGPMSPPAGAPDPDGAPDGTGEPSGPSDPTGGGAGTGEEPTPTDTPTPTMTMEEFREWQQGGAGATADPTAVTGPPAPNQGVTGPMEGTYADEGVAGVGGVFGTAGVARAAGYLGGSGIGGGAPTPAGAPLPAVPGLLSRSEGGRNILEEILDNARGGGSSQASMPAASMSPLVSTGGSGTSGNQSTTRRTETRVEMNVDARDSRDTQEVVQKVRRKVDELERRLQEFESVGRGRF